MSRSSETSSWPSCPVCKATDSVVMEGVSQPQLYHCLTCNALFDTEDTVQISQTAWNNVIEKLRKLEQRLAKSSGQDSSRKEPDVQSGPRNTIQPTRQEGGTTHV